jgi:hypothetical protein
MPPSLHDRLKALRSGLPGLLEALQLEGGPEMASWCKVVDSRLLTRFDPGFPLVAAICGGGSSGKSTLFNSLAGGRFSPVGGRAGMNRRVLFSLPDAVAEQSGFIASLVEPFGAPAEALQRPEDLLAAGGPLFVAPAADRLPLVLMDTPDFDTGSRGQYANRESAQAALEAADVLIYIFTNSNYNNRDNTDFVGRILTGIGRRKCFLVYRCYASFTPEEAEEHAMTVARNIYGAGAERWVLGVFRAEEDNAVAAGERDLRLLPLRKGGGSFAQALKAVDAAHLRSELHASMLDDVFGQAETFLNIGRESLAELRRYADGVRAVQDRCLQQALRHFPMDRVMRRFAKIWARTDPPAVKFMRRTGGLIELPLKALAGAAGWARGRLSGEPPAEKASQQFARRLEENLATALTDLHQQMLSPFIPSTAARASEGGGVPTAAVRAHPAVTAARRRLEQKDFSAVLRAVLARREEIGDIGAEMELELGELADHFRSRMGLWDKVGQTFWAFLNVLPAAAAVTYVLSTGDPVGGATIKVKLAGILGLKDLYALVAIPVTRGMKKADQKQLKAMLGPIAETWLSHKFRKVQELFELEVTGDILRSAERIAADAERRVAAVSEALGKEQRGSR